MRLVERDRELAQLTHLLDRCAAAAGSAAVIGGGIGCGKTELLSAVRRRAQDRGFVVLGAVGSWAERATPGGVVDQLRRSTPHTADRDRADRDRADPGPAGAAPDRLAEDLAAHAAGAPVLVCVDDVQFADSPSLRAILHLLRRLPGTRVALILVQCALSGAADPLLHAELLRQPEYHRVTVGRLSPAGVAAQLQDLLPGQRHAAAALAAGCHAASGGNPLLVRALAEDHRHAATGDPHPTGGAPTVADAFGDTVLSCLHRGRPVLLRLAQAIAVLDEDLGQGADVLARLIGEQPATVARGERALHSAGLLHGRRLRHRVARHAVLDSLSAAERRALHLGAAELLYQDGASSTRVAHHLVAAGAAAQGAGLPWALPVLRAAAERLLAANRAADAHAALATALAVCDDQGQRVALRALLASAAWLLDPAISVPHLGELAVALRDGQLPDRHALTLAKYLLWHGRYEEAVEAIGRMSAPAPTPGAGPGPGAGAELDATRELLCATYPALVGALAPGPRPTTRTDTGTDTGTDTDPRIRAAASLSQVLAHGPDESAVAAAEAAMRTMRLGKNTQEWLMCAAAALLFADRPLAAAHWCDHWLEEARARRVPLWVAEFSSLRASVALRQGDPATARRLSRAALAQVPAESWGVCIGGPLANLVQAATDTGDWATAAAYLDVPFPEGMYASRFGLYYLHARGRYHLATGHPYAALDDFTTCGDLMRRWAFDQPALVPWRAEAAWAHLALGDRPRARRLAREQLELTGPRPGRARAIALRALAATQDPAARPEPLTEAVEILRTCGDRLQLAGALADLGRAHVAAGRPAAAAPALAMAARLARQSGATPLLRTLQACGAAPQDGATTAPGTRPPGLDQLSAAERRVAALAARGHTNTEISEKLTVTVSTVEQHLTRIFRKLGVKARKDLPAESVLESTTT